MPINVLLTGFGPFPGAPYNPSAALVRALARRRRPAFVEIKRHVYVFPTSYAAVDHTLPRLIADIRPHVVLMFGLATRTRHVRVETQASNAVAMLLPDAHGGRSGTASIAPGKACRLRGNAPFRHLAAAGRECGVDVRLSRDAGRYLCNYLYWRALEAADAARKPPLVQFIHIPLARRKTQPRARGKRRRPTLDALTRAAEAMLIALLADARRR
jgi:pyroglutamyl-peptidase